MRATLLLCPLLVAGCATTPQDLHSMSVAEVCYLGVVQPEKRQMALDEVARRNDDCRNHAAEIAQIHDAQMRAQTGGLTQGSGAMRSGGMGMGGGMGRY
jgi:hypothetical protein